MTTTESEHKNLDNNWEKADTTALLSLIIEDLGDYPKFYSEDTVVLKPSGDESCEETATGEDCTKTTTAPPPPIVLRDDEAVDGEHLDSLGDLRDH